MKAVLEFSYPEDERKLLYALHGYDMYLALASIRKRLEIASDHANPVEDLAAIWHLVDSALKNVSE